MSDASSSQQHVSDDEIEAYWTDRLSETECQHVEEHYLVCTACLDRVHFVEDLVDTLKTPEIVGSAFRRTYVGPAKAGPHAWLGAAVLAGVCVVLASQWWRTARDLDAALTRADRAEAGRTVPPSEHRDDRTVTIVRLEPPLRSAAAPTVSPPIGAVVVLDIDAREVGAPGARFDVAVLASDRRPVVTVRGLASSATSGRLSLPVAAQLLVPGDYAVEIRAGDAVAELPFSIK